MSTDKTALKSELLQAIDQRRDEIVALTRHRDARDRGGQHVGTGGRLSSAPPSVERVLREWLALRLRATGAPPTRC